VAIWHSCMTSDGDDGYCIDCWLPLHTPEWSVAQLPSSCGLFRQKLWKHMFDHISHSAQQEYGMMRLDIHIVVSARIADHHTPRPLPRRKISTCLIGRLCLLHDALFIRRPEQPNGTKGQHIVVLGFLTD